MTTPSDKLTLHALKQHDGIHPRLQAIVTPRSILQPSKDARDKPQTMLQTESSPRQNTALKDSASRQAMKKHAMTVYRLVTATRSWQHYTKKAKSPHPHESYENTYRMEPEKTSKFSSAKVEAILKDVLESRLKDVRYNPELCRRYTTELVGAIRARTQTCGFQRYKLVCNVLIMQNKGQGSRVVSRGLLNTDTDSFATYTFRNATLVAVAYVHGLYFE
ncbi:hypothetical protein ACOMHN_018879 [Nucella lapillus]